MVRYCTRGMEAARSVQDCVAGKSRQKCLIASLTCRVPHAADGPLTQRSAAVRAARQPARWPRSARSSDAARCTARWRPVRCASTATTLYRGRGEDRKRAQWNLCRTPIGGRQRRASRENGCHAHGSQTPSSGVPHLADAAAALARAAQQRGTFCAAAHAGPPRASGRAPRLAACAAAALAQAEHAAHPAAPRASAAR